MVDELSIIIGFIIGVLFVFIIMSFIEWSHRKAKAQVAGVSMQNPTPNNKIGQGFSLLRKPAPVFYDANGNIIKAQAGNLPPSTPSISQPIYNFQADTTATIKSSSSVQSNTTNKPENSPEKSIKNPSCANATGEFSGYCHKCKEMRLIVDGHFEQRTSKQGTRHYVIGNCGNCGTGMGIMVSAKDAGV